MARVNRNALTKALDKIAPGVGAKESDIQATCFLLKNGWAFTFNDEISVRVPLPEEMAEEKINCVVMAKDFLSLLHRIKDEEINLELSDNFLKISSRRIEADIAIEATVRMPVSDIKIPKEFIELPATFREALKLCSPVASTDATKPLSMCLHLSENLVEVSDSYKAARYTLCEDNVFETPILLPAASADKIYKYAVTGYNTTQGWIHFQCNDEVIVSARTYYEKQAFVDLTPLIDREGTEVELPIEMLGALDRAKIFINSKGGEEILLEDYYVLVTIKTGWVEVAGQGVFGKYKEKCRLEYEGEEMSFLTKVETLIDALEKNHWCQVTEKLIKLADEKFCYIVAVIKQPETPKNKKSLLES